ncbi:hypothetical protein JD844_008941 [Phrynosoma platyrhinos]|uniref:Uncharacterized protein n=1 Tax=Phrynosoma platyrhinos TaxID=52577 RepID=A0ABQ7TER2_PHRPL|nr:hypothetical protein JD844_008941 [Phrynosoma platyrhinos]
MEEEMPTAGAAGEREEEEEEEAGHSAPASASGPSEPSEGCEGLWELPVELSARRPECSRCGIPQPDFKKKRSVISE